MDRNNDEGENDVDEANDGEGNVHTDEEQKEESVECTLFQGFRENSGMHPPLEHKHELKH